MYCLNEEQVQKMDEIYKNKSDAFKSYYEMIKKTDIDGKDKEAIKKKKDDIVFNKAYKDDRLTWVDRMDLVIIFERIYEGLIGIRL